MRSSVLLRLQRGAEDVAQRGAGVRRAVLLDRLLLFGDLARLDREVGLFRTVEADDHRIELGADLEAVGALLVAVAAEVAALDEASRAVVADLHFQPAVAHFEHGDGDHVVLLDRTGTAARRVRAAASGRGALLELLHAEADALLLDIDVEDDRLDLFTLAVKRQRVLARDA